MLFATKETFIRILSEELWKTETECSVLDLKCMQDYRVVVADMTLSKLLRMNHPGNEIILISAVRLHSIKENLSKAWYQWNNESHCWNKLFFKVYHCTHTYLLLSLP